VVATDPGGRTPLQPPLARGLQVSLSAGEVREPTHEEGRNERGEYIRLYRGS
jgi:hypothetical protein